MATRTKKKVVVVQDQAEAQEALKTFALASSQLKVIEGKIEQEIAKVRERYKGQINQLVEVKDESFERVQSYAEANKKELFVKNKSIEWLHGTLGYRLGTPKVDKVRGVTWDAALRLIRENGLTSFVRTKEEIDKDAIIGSRTDDKLMAELSKLGISVVQEESFFVEPKAEELVGV